MRDLMIAFAGAALATALFATASGSVKPADAFAADPLTQQLFGLAQAHGLAADADIAPDAVEALIARRDAALTSTASWVLTVGSPSGEAAPVAWSQARVSTTASGSNGRLDVGPIDQPGRSQVSFRVSEGRVVAPSPLRSGVLRPVIAPLTDVLRAVGRSPAAAYSEYRWMGVRSPTATCVLPVTSPSLELDLAAIRCVDPTTSMPVPPPWQTTFRWTTS